MTFAVDFDGVIYDGDAIDAGICDKIAELRAAGHKVVVHTSRAGEALRKAKELLDCVQVDDIVGGKYYADHYIDDRNMPVDDFLDFDVKEDRSMTPKDKIKFKDGAQMRAMQLAPAAENRRIQTERYVEGYAARYDPYLLYDFGDDGKTFERFEPGCFDHADLSDVILQFDHAGRVFARNTNGSLLVEPDMHGLFMAADLDRTELARGLYEDISAGMITKMSWRFMPGKWHVEEINGSRDITIVHTEIRKVYDVSAVSIPANNDTEINARDFAAGVRREAARREAELEERRRRLAIKLRLEAIK